MASRYYSSVAALTSLSASVSAAGTSITVGSTSGFPAQTPFTLLLDEATASEELVEVTNVAGTTLTVTRGIDGTVATAHDPGARVRHALSARDLREAREHEAASTDVHGVTGDVVGTTDTQTLEHKTFAVGADDQTPLTVVSRAGADPGLLATTDTAIEVARINNSGIYVGGEVGSATVALQNANAAAVFGEVVEVRSQSNTIPEVRVVHPGTGKAIVVENAGSETASISGGGAVVCSALTVDGVVYVPPEAPDVQVFTASGTWTKPSGAKLVKVQVQAGGGSGGGASATGAGEASSGGGGGGGGYAECFLDPTTLAATEAVTVGAGGAAAAAGGAGNAGGNSSFDAVSATGGSGGALGAASAVATASAGGAGGGATTSGTGFAVHGEDGAPGITQGTLDFRSSHGGGSVLSPSRRRDASNASVAGRTYGGGSTGAGNGQSSAARASTAGAPGIVIVTTYF